MTGSVNLSGEMTSGLPWIEYLVVLVSLVTTTGIGLYCSKSGKKSLEEYMFGGRRMTVLPMTLSMTATLMTSSALIGGGQELYLYGSQALSMIFSAALGSLCGAYFFLPIMYALDTVSPYEFFDRRYNRHVRRVISAISVLDTMQHVVMSLYVPSLTFSQATGISTFKICCALAAVCFVYTVSGGLKAVTWADSFQMIILVTCTIFFFTAGIVKTGGFSEVWRLNDEGDRMEFFNFDPSPSQRLTFWTTFGVFFVWTPHYLDSSQHQRYKSLPTLTQARRVVLLSMVLMISLVVIQYSIGLLAYAYFAGCDPVLAKMGVRSHSTIIPYFVSQIAVNHPGMAGLFHADVIAAGLSTVTSLWNTLACTIYVDLVRPFMKNTSEKKAYRIIISLVVILAIISTSLTKAVEMLGGTIMETLLVLRTTTQSSIFVLFTAGMFIPWINAKGITAGGLAAAGTSIIVLIGNVSARKSGLLKDHPKFLTTENCPANFSSSLANATLTMGVAGYGSHTFVDDSVFWLFKLSIYYIQVPGLIVGIVTSIVVSFLTGPQSLETVDPQMIVPQMRWLLPSNVRNKINDDGNVVQNDKVDEEIMQNTRETYALVPQEGPVKETVEELEQDTPWIVK